MRRRRIWGEGLITFDVRLRLADYCDGRAPLSPPPPPHFGPSLNFFSSINTGSNTERGNRANEPNLGLNLRGPAIWLNLKDWHSVFWLTNYLEAVCSSWFVNHAKRIQGTSRFTNLDLFNRKSSCVKKVVNESNLGWSVISLTLIDYLRRLCYPLLRRKQIGFLFFAPTRFVLAGGNRFVWARILSKNRAFLVICETWPSH